MAKIVYATGNPGKFQEVKKFLASRRIEVHSPREYGIKLTVEESGDTLEENATLKAEAYLAALPKNCVVIGDDTGVEIEALDGEPGIRVRRWIGETMIDQAIIKYCLKRMKAVPPGKRAAQFRTVLALARKNRPTRLFAGILRGHIVQKAIPLKIKGFPFESLFFADEYQLMLGEIHQLSSQEKQAGKIFTHRERALINALPALRSII